MKDSGHICTASKCIRNVKDKKALLAGDPKQANIAFAIERNCRALRMGECPKDRKDKNARKL